MDLLSISDLSSEELISIIKETAKVKDKASDYSGLLNGKTIVLLFEKPSTRTRVSFQAGMFQLGGNSIYLDSSRSQISRGESPGAAGCRGAKSPRKIGSCVYCEKSGGGSTSRKAVRCWKEVVNTFTFITYILAE